MFAFIKTNSQLMVQCVQCTNHNLHFMPFGLHATEKEEDGEATAAATKSHQNEMATKKHTFRQ